MQIGKIEAAYFLFFMAGVSTGLGLRFAIIIILFALFYHHRFVTGGTNGRA